MQVRCGAAWCGRVGLGKAGKLKGDQHGSNESRSTSRRAQAIRKDS